MCFFPQRHTPTLFTGVWWCTFNVYFPLTTQIACEFNEWKRYSLATNDILCIQVSNFPLDRRSIRYLVSAVPLHEPAHSNTDMISAGCRNVCVLHIPSIPFNVSVVECSSAALVVSIAHCICVVYNFSICFVAQFIDILVPTVVTINGQWNKFQKQQRLLWLVKSIIDWTNNLQKTLKGFVFTVFAVKKIWMFDGKVWSILLL